MADIPVPDPKNREKWQKKAEEANLRLLAIAREIKRRNAEAQAKGQVYSNFKAFMASGKSQQEWEDALFESGKANDIAEGVDPSSDVPLASEETKRKQDLARAKVRAAQPEPLHADIPKPDPDLPPVTTVAADTATEQIPPPVQAGQEKPEEGAGGGVTLDTLHRDLEEIKALLRASPQGGGGVTNVFQGKGKKPPNTPLQSFFEGLGFPGIGQFFAAKRQDEKAASPSVAQAAQASAPSVTATAIPIAEALPPLNQGQPGTSGAPGAAGATGTAGIPPSAAPGQPVASTPPGSQNAPGVGGIPPVASPASWPIMASLGASGASANVSQSPMGGDTSEPGDPGEPAKDFRELIEAIRDLIDVLKSDKQQRPAEAEKIGPQPGGGFVPGGPLPLHGGGTPGEPRGVRRGFGDGPSPWERAMTRVEGR